MNKRANPPANASSEAGSAPQLSWWRRRIVAPLTLQLTQGLTPERLALALAIGGVIAVNPFLGTTTLGCVAAGVLLRLNQPALQIANLLAVPFQLALILPWVRAGEWLYGAAPMPLDPTALASVFTTGPACFLARFGESGLHAASAWLLAAPLLGAVFYFALRPVLRALGRRLTQRGGIAPSASEPARAPAIAKATAGTARSGPAAGSNGHD